MTKLTKTLTNSTNTTFETQVSHVPVTKTTQKLVNNETVTETNTEIEVVTKMVPVQNNVSTVSNINYIFTKNRTRIPIEDLIKICKNPSFEMRVYNADNDFWTINFNQYNIKELWHLINQKVPSSRISVY